MSSGESSETKDDPEPMDILCIFCPSMHNKPFTKLSAHVDVEHLLKSNNIDYNTIPEHTDYICFQCVYKFSKIKEFLHLCKKNFINQRINYYYKTGNMEMVKMYINSSSNSHANLDELETASVSHIRENDEQTQNVEENSLIADNVRGGEILTVLQARSEPADSLKRSHSREYMVCEVHKKRYIRRDQFRKHIRQFHTPSKNKKSPKNSNNRLSQREEGISRSNIRKSHPLFVCKSCDKRFTSRFDYDIHEDSCQMEQENCKGIQTRSLRAKSVKSMNILANENKSVVEDDDISITDSLYSTKLKNVEEWMKTICDRDDTVSLLSECTEYPSESQMTTETDLKNTFSDVFKCPEANCPIVESSIVKLYSHDCEEHPASILFPLFVCKKCYGRFSRKIYLDYHMRYQNEGRFVCNKCEECFLLEHDLKLHFAAHNSLRNFTCNMCSVSYLSKEQYEQHIDSQTHLKKSKWELKQLFCTNFRISAAEPKKYEPYKVHIRVLKTFTPPHLRSKYCPMREQVTGDLCCTPTNGSYNCFVPST